MAPTSSKLLKSEKSFDSLNDDVLNLVLEFVGKSSYNACGAINKRCHEMYLSKEWSKETLLFGYAPLSLIMYKCITTRGVIEWKVIHAVGRGVVYYNRTDVFQWALIEQKTFLLIGICRIIAEAGRVDLLSEAWIHYPGCYEKKYIFLDLYTVAARNGRVNVLSWLVEHGFLINEGYCANQAAKKGHLKVLDWIKDEGYEMSEEECSRCCESAARGGCLHILKWFRKKLGYQGWNERTFEAAVWNGNLRVLKFLRDQKCPFSKNTFAHAIRRGNMKTLEYLRENNFPWTGQCYNYAAWSGNIQVLNWLRDHGCPKRGSRIEFEERRNMHLFKPDVEVWLRDNGFVIPL